ncbi:MAG: hypothetical protein U0V49_14735 [Saprospiraceae bacterium]
MTIVMERMILNLIEHDVIVKPKHWLLSTRKKDVQGVKGQDGSLKSSTHRH